MIESQTPGNFIRCIGCCCKDCDEIRKYRKTLANKKLETKVHEVTTTTPPPPLEVHVNICDGDGFQVKKEFLINYTDLGCQVKVLDIGALVSLAGTKWLEQYLGEFDLTIEEMESSPCHQVFQFGPIKRYFSTLMVKIPVIGMTGEMMY